MSEICSKCKLDKNCNEFAVDKRAKSGFQSACKSCREIYYKNNKEKYILKAKNWGKYNLEKVRKYKDKWLEKNWDKRLQWQRDRRLNNPQIRLNDSISALINIGLKGGKCGRSWQEFVGYNIQELVDYLEKQFDDKMSWNNYGKYWEIDHIKPRSLFKYEKPEDNEFKECWGLNNLQPLSVRDNRIKSNYYNNPVKLVI